MRLNIAKDRINQVINVDSINNEDYDFMATHIPLKKIVWQDGVYLDKNLENIVKKERLSENDIFYRLFEDPNVSEKHQLVIVNGSSGSGKSHFIRWLYTNLLAKKDETLDNEILLITRSDNTLKGTIKQLLKIDAIKNLRNKDIYERLVKANSTISDAKFKEEIFAKFIVEINVSDDELLNSLEKKRLVALLNNDLYKSKLMSADGPIERIFSKIVATNVSNLDIIAEFRKDDLIISTSFFDEMRDTADSRAVSIAKKLVTDDIDGELLTRIITFMNKKVDDVIQSCAGIEPGDFEQIFKEIRQELFKQGKNLILLIEDITSFTGVNQALLNVLITAHTGLNASDNLCKLVSIVGATKQYYDTFRDNYKDRITTQITIEDGTLGQDMNDLYLFFAKYLNAISIMPEEFKEWYINTGADEKQMPVHNPDVEEWESVIDGGLKLSLYPFTKQSISNLYDFMEVNKTPRYILLEIIKPAIDELIKDKSKFTTYLIRNTKPDLGDAALRISTIIDKLDIDNKEEYKNRAITFISFWGNGKLKRHGNMIAGIPKNVFNEFNFTKLWEELIKVIDSTEVPNPVPDPVPGSVPGPVPGPVSPLQPQNKQYEKFKKMLDGWYFKKEVFVQPRYILEELNGFIYNTINWQQFGISNNRIKTILESGYASNLVSFKRQEKNYERGLIKLDDSMDTYKVLNAAGQWYYLGNKSWDFEKSYNAIFIITCWIENIKPTILKIVRDYKKDDVPSYVKAAIESLIVEKILRKQISASKIEDISVEELIKPIKNTKIESVPEGKWLSLMQFCNSNALHPYNIVVDYFSLVQGNKEGGHKYLDYVSLERTLDKIKKSFANGFNEYPKSKYPRENDIIEYYSKLVKNVPDIIKDEETNINEKITNIFSKFGWDISDDITTTDLRELLDEISDFYKRVEQNNLLPNDKEYIIQNYKEESKYLINNLHLLMSNNSTSLVSRLLNYANGDIKLLVDFSNFLDKVERDVDMMYPRIEDEMDTLTKQGKWVEEDPRFSEKKEIIDKCLKALGV